VDGVEADYIDSSVRGELDTLRLLVEETDGNVIAFVRYRRVTEREAGVRYLKEQLSLPVVERVLSEERKNPLALVDNLPDERCCVQLYDLEAALPEVTGYLNVNREAYAEVSHALVFWVGEHGLREVATNAPDFWAWRSGVFDLRSEEPGLAQSVSQVALADDVQFTDRGDLERRAELYEGLIQEYEGADEEYVARLRLKLTGVLYLLRRRERAEKEAYLAKEYAERENSAEIAAEAYHRLGVVAQGRGSLEEAEEWYRKSLEIEEHLGAERGMAATYHELGVLAQARHKLEEAEEWYHKSLEIKEQLGDEHIAVTTYHQLGTIAQERGDLEEAEQWYRKSLEISERLSDEHGIAQTYHQLGMVAHQQRDLEEAEQWYEEAVRIQEQLGDEHGVALTRWRHGDLARERENIRQAGRWYLKAIRGFNSTNDNQRLTPAIADFVSLFDRASSDIQGDLYQQWIDAGFPSEQLDDFLEQFQAEQSG